MSETALSESLKAAKVRRIEIARAVGVDKATVTRWVKGRVPAERVLDVERVSGVSRHVIRPDLYPAEAPAPEVAP